MKIEIIIAAIFAIVISSKITSSESSNQYIRPCYFTNWAQYRPGRGKFVPEDYVPGLCTHIMFAFAVLNPDFTAKVWDPADLPTSWAGKGMYARVNDLKNSDPELKTFLSFGGWNFGTKIFEAMASTRSNRAVFIQSAIDLVREHKFDGIDIDWEYPGISRDEIVTDVPDDNNLISADNSLVSDNPADKPNFALLMKEFREAIRNEASNTGRTELLLTAAVSAAKEKIDIGYDVPEIQKYLDFVLVMSYDFHGAWEEGTGHNSPLFPRENEPENFKRWNIDFATDYWHQLGMPKHKIIVGFANYGRGWTLTNPGTDSGLDAATSGPSKSTPYARVDGIATYYELCDMLSQGATRHWIDSHKVPYLVHGDQWYGYDDEESIGIKMRWLKDEGYGGAFIWNLDFDDFNGGSCGAGKYPLTNVIKSELSGTRPPSTPSTRPPVTTPTRTTTPRTTTWPDTTPRTTTSGGVFSCNGNGHQKDPTSCSHFYYCLGSTSWRFPCPAGLHFNEAAQICDWPANAGCQ